MPKYLTKISKFGGQYRITIPKALVEELNWHDVDFVIMEHICYEFIRIRRFIDGESLKASGQALKDGLD